MARKKDVHVACKFCLCYDERESVCRHSPSEVKKEPYDYCITGFVDREQGLHVKKGGVQ